MNIMFNITTLIPKSQKEFAIITTSRINQTNIIIVLLEKLNVAQKCVCSLHLYYIFVFSSFMGWALRKLGQFIFLFFLKGLSCIKTIKHRFSADWKISNISMIRTSPLSLFCIRFL